jgi:hypothetical protein
MIKYKEKWERMVRKHEGEVAINSDEQQSVGVAMDVCNRNVIVK